jgi:hypothetical protein
LLQTDDAALVDEKNKAPRPPLPPPVSQGGPIQHLRMGRAPPRKEKTIAAVTQRVQRGLPKAPVDGSASLEEVSGIGFSVDKISGLDLTTAGIPSDRPPVCRKRLFLLRLLCRD